MRHIGVDLHKTNFAACLLAADDTQRLETCPLYRDGLARFRRRLGKADELAVEAAQNVHHFFDQVKAHVSRVAVVDTHRFGVIAKSKKKTGKADACALARLLKLGWLPEVAVPTEQVRCLRQLLQARETLVPMRTKLRNMPHAAFSRNGVALTRSAFASGASRARPAGRGDLPAVDLLVLRACLRQMEQLDGGVAQVEAEVGDIALFDTSKQLVSYPGWRHRRGSRARPSGTAGSRSAGGSGCARSSFKASSRW